MFKHESPYLCKASETTIAVTKKAEETTTVNFLMANLFYAIAAACFIILGTAGAIFLCIWTARMLIVHPRSRYAKEGFNGI